MSGLIGVSAGMNSGLVGVVGGGPGSVVQVAFSALDPSNETTSSTSFQSSAIFQNIEKTDAANRCLVTVAGGHMYVGGGYPNGCISTICRQSSSSSFTHSNTYSSSDDPASNEGMGMQQVYSHNLSSTSHSKQYFYTSSGNKFESFRVFWRSRGGGSVTNHETNHNVTITVMEIQQ